MLFRKKNLFAYLLLGSSLFAAPLSDFAMQGNQKNYFINNRILLKINGKPITVMDIVKKMDLLFYRQYPDLASSDMARFQFYVSGWRSILGAVLDDHLIMADAEEKGIDVSDGEVREELEKLFGPDVVINLDKLNMSLEEAVELLKTELTVQKMTSIMVRSKALTEIHPKSIKERYETWVKQNPAQDVWIYQVLSFRGKNHKEAAQKAERLLSENLVPIDRIADEITEENIQISISEEYHRKEKDLSLSHKATLQSLAVGAFSSPETQKEVTRIFCLKDKEQKSPSSFKEVSEKVKRELIDEAIAKHNKSYREKLREHYGLSEKFLQNEIPAHLEPFSVR